MGERILRSFIVYCLIGAYPTTLIFGVPIYFLLRKRVRPSAVNCMLAGGVAAALPWVVLFILPLPAQSGAIDGGHVTILDGHRTIAGWLYAGQAVAAIGGLGLLAGFVFWVVATRFHRSARTA
jgi:hypothetical protein